MDWHYDLADVYILQSLYGGPAETINDKLIWPLFFVGALRDAGAERVTAFVPYAGVASPACRVPLDDATKPLGGRIYCLPIDRALAQGSN